MDSSKVTVDDNGTIVTVNFASSDQLVAADASIMVDTWDALDQKEASKRKVLLIQLAEDALSPELLDDFWKRASEAPIDHAPRGGFAIPHILATANNSVRRILEFLTSVRAVTIMAFSGRVDFDLLGLPLACRYRICTPETFFVNKGLARSVSPGSGALWFLTQIVGRHATKHLYLDQTTVTADTALEMGIVDQVVGSDSIERESLAVAERFAAFNAEALGLLFEASHIVDLDLTSYLDRVGTGFDKLPSV